MHLPLSIAVICATISNVNAAFLPFTTPVRQVANVSGGYLLSGCIHVLIVPPVR
jgi:hypothetical protein